LQLSSSTAARTSEERLSGVGRTAALALEQPGAQAEAILQQVRRQEHLDAYRIETFDEPSGELQDITTRVLAGYFPVKRATHREVLVLEAGDAFEEGGLALRRAAIGSSGVAVSLVVVCLIAMILSLRQANREAELRERVERGELMRQMAASVAHEVRNPLATVRAGLELLAEGSKSQSNELIDDLLEEIDRLVRLSTQLLDLARQAPLFAKEIDLGKVCDALLEQVARQQPGEGALKLLRSGEPTLMVEADPDKVQQILLNLVLNAIEATGHKGTVRVIVQRAGADAEVLVEDSGNGLPPPADLAQRLLVPYRSGRVGGTGLGLVLSRRLAEQHGGELKLVRASMGGACFALRLPRHALGSAGQQTAGD
jgi:signal transduction histidine kinase